MAKKPPKAKAKAAPKAAKAAKSKPSKRSDQKQAIAAAADVIASDPSLFAPLTPGEVADAVRTLTEDRRVAGMAKVGRYRVIATEPLVVKPPHWMAGHRLARVVVYDYAADRCVDASVDLDAGVVAHLDINKAQPMLSREEESFAISVAVTDERVREKLVLGDEPLIAMHYWGKDGSDLAFERRSAAVVFGRPGGHATMIAVVDLLDNAVTAVVPAAQW
jgi:Cu2+-containing amine oxidase